ncbi:MAG: DUF6272 family protein [Bacteroidales bacterium]
MADSILNHTGLLTFSSIDTLLTEFKYVSQEHGIRFTVYKKVLTVIIESLENVYKYTDEYKGFVSENKRYLPTFEIIKDSETIRLKTSNPVRNNDVEVLKAKIDQVNNKNKDELRDLYLETITNGRFSAKGGAGLGFIEMAKTSGNNLKYSFEQISDKYSLYTFIVTFAI